MSNSRSWQVCSYQPQLGRQRDQMLLESRSLTTEHMHEIRISVRSPRHCSLTGFHILGVLVSYLETGGKKVYISE